MTLLLGLEAFRLLSKYNIPWVKTVKVDDLTSLFNWKLPFYMKAISPSAIHKTEAKGISKITDYNQIEKEYNRLRRIGTVEAQHNFEGIELIIGAKKDAVFDHVVVCGLGGTMVEVMKDVSFRACPITRKDAGEMLQELKSYKVLHGFRGKKANIEEIKRALVNTSNLAVREDIFELDINPFIVDKNRGYAIDARIVL